MLVLFDLDFIKKSVSKSCKLFILHKIQLEVCFIKSLFFSSNYTNGKQNSQSKL